MQDEEYHGEIDGDFLVKDGMEGDNVHDFYL